MFARTLIVASMFLAGCVGAAPGEQASEFASTQQAASSTTTVRWSGGNAIKGGGGYCYMCGADYACNQTYAGSPGSYGQWEGGLKTFLDPHPPGSLVTGVTVHVNACTWDDEDSLKVELNGTVIGYASPGRACGCNNANTCGTATTTLTNVAGLPGYVYGGTNTLKLTSAGPNFFGLCVTHADIQLLTADSPMPSASPASLAFDTRDMGTSSDAQSVTITNPGPYSTVIEGVALPLGFQEGGVEFPVVLQAEETATFEIVFAPVFDGAADADLVFDTSVGALRVPVSGMGRGPALSVSPVEVVMPDADFGSSSTVTLTLSNGGSADLVVTSLGADSEEFALTATLPLTIAPGASAQATVTFSPLRRGTRSATLLIGSNAHPAPFEVAVQGTGLGAAVSSSVYDLQFPNTPLDTWSDQQFELTNVGERPLVVTGVAMFGSAAADYTSPTTFPLTIEPGATGALTVRFTPQWAERRRAELRLQSNAAQDPLRLPLDGTGITSTMTRTPGLWDFGSVSPAGPAATKEFTFTSSGQAPLIIRGADFFGLDMAAFELVSHPFPITLEPGESTTATVAFLPQRAGAHSVFLQFDSTAGNNSSARIELKGTGAAGEVSFASGDTLRFGYARVDTTTAPREATLRNSGNMDVEITALTIVGEDAASFSIVDPPALPTTLAPNATLKVTLSATPSAETEQTAALRVTSDAWGAPASDLTLSVIGFGSSYTASETALSFGLVRVPDTVTRTLEVRNAIWAPVTFDELRLEGEGAEAFSVSPNPFTVPANGSATLTVMFAPTEAVEATATLTLVKDDTELSVALDGRAVTSALAATPTTLEFGDVQVDTTSAGRGVTLSNVLDVAVTVERVRISDPAFVMDTQTPFTLEPGGRTTVEVSFAPGKLAAYEAHLRFVLEGQVEPDAVVAVSGTGVEEVQAPDAGDVPEEPRDREPGCGCGGGGTSWALLLPLLVGFVARRRFV